MYVYREPYPNELYHHGIVGMKWGVRRFQNSDGTLTEAGKKRYGDYSDSNEKKLWKNTSMYERHMARTENKLSNKLNKKANKYMNAEAKGLTEMQREKHKQSIQKTAKGLKAVQDMSDTFYSMSVADQQKIARAHSTAIGVSAVAGFMGGISMLPVALIAGGVAGTVEKRTYDKYK